MCRDWKRPAIRTYKNNMAGSALPPFDAVSVGDSFQAFYSPVKWVVLHLLENFVGLAHKRMILNTIAEGKRRSLVEAI